MSNSVCPPIACALFVGCLELSVSIMLCFLLDDDLEQYIRLDTFHLLDPDNIFIIPFLTFKNFLANVVNILISLLLIFGLVQRNRWFMLPWLIKEAAIVMILFTISIIVFSVICFLIGEMIFKRMGVHSYPGAFLFAVYIPYSVVLLVVDVLSICFWVEIYNIYDYMKWHKKRSTSIYHISDGHNMAMTAIEL